MVTDNISRAKSIADSANRLVRLLERGAPSIIIESERWILARRVIGFPAPESEVAFREETEELTRKAEYDHLMKTGYFADALGDEGTPE